MATTVLVQPSSIHLSPYIPHSISHDVEDMIQGLLRSLWRGLQTLIPMRRPGDNYRRIFTSRSWTDMYGIVQASSGDFLWHLFMGSLALALYIGSLILSITSAYPVISDSVAASEHPGCNLVQVNESLLHQTPAYVSATMYFNDIARENRQYAKSCYSHTKSSNGSGGPDACSSLYQPAIRYYTRDNDVCPFITESGHLCAGGYSSAFTVHTELEDAKALGINSPLRYTFRRSLICSPLETEGGLVERVTDENDNVCIRFFFGNNTGDKYACPDIDDCTFEICPTLASPRAYTLL